MSKRFPAGIFILITLLLFRASAADRLGLRTNDVVAVLGGGSAVASARSGHLETILAATHPGHHLRIRSLAWEGDTVFNQQREVNYPSPQQQLALYKATVCILDFGQGEAFQGKERLASFSAALEGLISRLTNEVSRLILVTPVPVFSPPATGPVPPVAAYAEAIREIAKRGNYPVIDMFRAAEGNSSASADGRNLTPFGLGRTAAAALGPLLGGSAIPPLDTSGRFTDPAWENLRQSVLEKGALWKGYVRPTNWAFLGGDRTEQPSSRDHVKMSIRWFPAEMEQFVPLIDAADRKIDELARNLPADGTAR